MVLYFQLISEQGQKEPTALNLNDDVEHRQSVILRRIIITIYFDTNRMKMICHFWAVSISFFMYHFHTMETIACVGELDDIPSLQLNHIGAERST